MMTQAEMIEALKTGEHRIRFAKKDGELRTARGWLPGFATAKNDTAVPFVESDTGLWKSFIAENVVEFTHIGPCPE